MHKKLDSIEKKIGGSQRRIDDHRGDETRVTDVPISEAQREERRILSDSLHLSDEEQNGIRQGRVRTRPQGANRDFQAIQKTYATVGRSGYPTLKDKNHACKGRQNQATLTIKNSVLSSMLPDLGIKTNLL